MISLLYFLDFSLKSYNVCEFNHNYDNYDYCTLRLCQTAARQFEASFHVGQTNWTAEQDKRAK